MRKNLGLHDARARSRPRWSAALDDDEHVAEQHARYAARRGEAARGARARRLPDRPLRGVALPLGAPATRTAGTTVSWLADRGILVAPGSFYGRAGDRHVRVAFTATDERIDAAAPRLRVRLGIVFGSHVRTPLHHL